MSRFSNVCVFCGASPGARPEYAQAAAALGHELIKRNIGLVYGGGSAGLMGTISSTVHANGGKVLGVIPKELEPREMSGDAVGEVSVVSGMHERKALMAEKSDAFISLPGGYGTMEELMEMVTWQQLGYHSKPVGLLNIDGFYDSLLAFFDKLVTEGFVRPEMRKIVVSARTPAELLDLLEAYERPESYFDLGKAQKLPHQTIETN